ncbi:glycosyltransferase family 2 protein [Cellulophaga sp. L1A9]|uniref:glycosyltransferase family 2 protein n=1 Tax=Cellulophaga sp. L1A9 TaxID=2686362 RepID=UPI00131B5DEE|nr:glycosyltransferase family 2 protein [Cellulophaga sp. L1A9]
MKEKLSVFIITYNEERILDKCLNKLSWADEIIVVDSGSTDATLEICKKYHVKLFHKDFEGFGTQKQFALEKTTNNWVLSLDADEILSEELITEIQENLKPEMNISGFYLKRKHVFLGKVFDYGPDSKEYILRLFNKNMGKFDGKKVHENIILEGESAKLKNNFLHFTTRSLDNYIVKLSNYATIYAEGKYLKNKNYSIATIFIRVKLEFFKKYFVELNFLNGKEGFYWSYLAAYYMGLKYMKTNEQYKQVKKQLMF